MTDYGSGTLGSWSALSHAVSTNWATARVGIVGDSITSIGYNELAAALNTEYGAALAYDYWSGRPTTPAVDALLSRNLWPEVLVCALGTNDWVNPPVMAAQIARVQAAAPPTTQLLWVDVQVCRTSQTGTVQIADQRLTNWVNNQIWGSGVQVVPWSYWLAGSSMGGRLAYYLRDGVHPYDGPTPGYGNGTAFWCEVLMKSIRPLLDA